MDGSELDTASIQYFGLKTVAFVTHCSHLLRPLRSVAIFPHQIKDNKIFHDSCLNISHQDFKTHTIIHDISSQMYLNSSHTITTRMRLEKKLCRKRHFQFITVEFLHSRWPLQLMPKFEMYIKKD